MFAPPPTHLPGPLRSPRGIVALAVGTAAAAGVAWYMLTRPKPDAEEMERTRRDTLASTGRITDGSITDVKISKEEPASHPNLIIYNYRIGGVTYECAQVISALADYVRDRDIRIDLPVQVRYDPHNPADSIVVAEHWNGLRIDHIHPSETETSPQHAAVLRDEDEPSRPGSE